MKDGNVPFEVNGQVEVSVVKDRVDVHIVGGRTQVNVVDGRTQGRRSDDNDAYSDSGTS